MSYIGSKIELQSVAAFPLPAAIPILATAGFRPQQVWSPNGSLLAICAESGLRVVNVLAFPEKPYGVAGECGAAAFAPDGTTLAYGDQRELVVVDATMAAPLRRVVTNTRATFAWAPQGNQLLYANPVVHLATITEAGASSVQLGHSPGEFAWSSSGAHLAFTSGTSLFALSFTPGQPTAPVPLSGPTPVTRFEWAGDVGVVFGADRELHYATVANPTPKSIFSGAATTLVWSVSPDGAWLAFTVLTSAYLVDLRSSSMTATPITNHTPFTSQPAPTWSPDSKHVVFSSPGSTWLVAPNQPTAPHALGGRTFAFDPSGATLAVVEAATGSSSSVVQLLDVTSTPPRRGNGITLGASSVAVLAWSKDSTRLAMGTDSIYTDYLYLARVQGTLASSANFVASDTISPLVPAFNH